MHAETNTHSASKAPPTCGAFAPTIPASAFSMRFSRNEEIFGELEPATYVYRVISGAARTYTMGEDGRRQIDAFHLPGDIFGLETGDEHRFSAEAVSDCEIAIVSRAAIERLAAQDGNVARELWRLTSGQLGRVRDHMLMLGKKGAVERVVAFLHELAERQNEARTLHLPMSRTDIADYLGLTIETVSRCFTKLERHHAIALDGARTVNLRNLDCVSALAA